MEKLLRSSSGQVAVLYAGIAAVLIGAIALGADVAVMYVNWEQLQTAADAAALAGANYLPQDPADAQTAASTYAKNKGIQSGEIAGTSVSADDLSITVNLTRTVPAYFAQVLNMTSASVSVKATAGIQQNGADGRGLMPLGLSCPGGSSSGQCSGYSVGQTYTLKKDQSQTSLSGNWGALALGGNGANVYQQNIELGYTGSIATGDSVTTETGDIVGPTGQAIGNRVTLGATVDPTIAAGSAPASGAARSSYEYDPRLVVIPMVDYKGSAKSGGKTTVPVVQFAQMWLLGASGNNATVTAVFMGIATDSSTSSTASNFGMLSSILSN